MIFNSPQLSDGTSVCNIYCTSFHLQFRDNDMHFTSLRLFFSMIVHVLSLILTPIWESEYFWFRMLIQYVDAILSVFWLCMLEKFLYLIC